MPASRSSGSCINADQWPHPPRAKLAAAPTLARCRLQPTSCSLPHPRQKNHQPKEVPQMCVRGADRCVSGGGRSRSPLQALLLMTRPRKRLRGRLGQSLRQNPSRHNSASFLPLWPGASQQAPFAMLWFLFARSLISVWACSGLLRGSADCIDPCSAQHEQQDMEHGKTPQSPIFALSPRIRQASGCEWWTLETSMHASSWSLRTWAASMAWLTS